MNARLQELCDRADILACMQRYARGMDRRDRELVRSAYHDGATDEHIGFVGHVDEFIDWAFAYHETQARYQHYLLNHTADIAGDQARGNLLSVRRHRPRAHESADRQRGSLHRPARASRRALGHRRTSVCRRMAHRGPSADHDETMGFLADILTVAHDHSDISYERPLKIVRSPSHP